MSGLALNHVADWNPNYRQTRTVVQVAPLAGADRDALIADARRKLALDEAPRNAFRPDPDTLQLFYDGRTYLIDVPTGQVIVERTRTRPVLFELNQMHVNAQKGVWTVIADLYALVLIGMALTGLFIVKGRYGLGGRGRWLVVAGVALPLIAWWLQR